MSGSDLIRLLILGTGKMAGQHAEHFLKMESVEVVAAADVMADRVQRFVLTHGIPHAFSALDEALLWGEFDAVANVTPDNMHHATTLLALAAGKHVFCEKPLATDYLKALEMTHAAQAAGVVNMVNLTYRNVAELQKARALVTSGAIGAVRHIEASYLQSWLTAPTWGDWRTESGFLWRLSKAHGSNGTLGDIGIHILDFAAYGAGLEIADMSCRLKAFPKAENDRIGDYVLDANDSFVMAVEFDNGALGAIHATRFATGHLNDLRLSIYGTSGAIEVNHAPAGSSIRICTDEDIATQTWREIEAEAVETNYLRFVRAIRGGGTFDPDFAHAARLQRIIDLGLATEGATPLARGAP